VSRENTGGLSCVAGHAAALAYRDKEDVGQHVDVSLMEAAATVDEYSAAMYVRLGAIRRRYYSRHLFSFPSDIYRCKDGYVVVSPPPTAFLADCSGPGRFADVAASRRRRTGPARPVQHDRWARWFRWQEFEGLISPTCQRTPPRR
jgi:crotonobetainyl-CoA:carnitine CoA-transferase CaiB-like acyl-CoA transferase